MKIAPFKVENLFDRTKAFNHESAEAKAVVTLKAELNTLFRKPVYTQADKDRMLEIMKVTGILKSDNGPEVVPLLKRHTNVFKINNFFEQTSHII